MRQLFLILLFTCIPSFANEGLIAATPAPLLACPQCGEWELAWASGGMTGESVTIKADRVTIPDLGSFCAHALKQSVTTDSDGSRRYLLTLNLSRSLTSCTQPDQDSLRMELEIGNGFSKEASEADIKIYRPLEKEAWFEAWAWNNDRENPCETGAGGPSSTCSATHLARKIKRLAYAAYMAQAYTPKREATAFRRSFKLTDFMLEVQRFCGRREAKRGGGNWPTFWSNVCQGERLDTKLVEIEAWRICVEANKTTCKAPTHRFDKSKDPDYEY